jgi:peptidyl-prolyl cis-trans isomerase B (cyclophilin B)
MMLAALVLTLVPDGLRSAGGVKLSIESPEKVYRPGQKMPLRFTIENDSEAEAKLDEPDTYLEGLEIRDPEDRVVKATGKTKGITRRTPNVEPGGFIGRTLDIASVLPVAEAKEGYYRIRWSFGEATSNEIRILVIRDWTAEIETNYGKITIEFRADLAPQHVLNFVRLSRMGFYEASLFHRIIPGFMMQGGGPAAGKPEVKPLKAEFSSVKHGFGTVSAARTNDPDSATSQFFICFGVVPHLDNNYTVFGHVLKGDDVVKEIEKVKTDHNPCRGCGAKPTRPGATACCGRPEHHQDRPESDVVIKKVTLVERKK